MTTDSMAPATITDITELVVASLPHEILLRVSTDGRCVIGEVDGYKIGPKPLMDRRLAWLANDGRIEATTLRANSFEMPRYAIVIGARCPAGNIDEDRLALMIVDRIEEHVAHVEVVAPGDLVYCLFGPVLHTSVMIGSGWLQRTTVAEIGLVSISSEVRP